MPRTRKNTKWMVSAGGRVVTDIKSKTYRGACFKAFKKLNMKPPKSYRRKINDWKQPLTIRYDEGFENVYCVAIPE